MKSTQGRLTLLKARAAARAGMKQYGESNDALQAEIRRLEAGIAQRQAALAAKAKAPTKVS